MLSYCCSLPPQSSRPGSSATSSESFAAEAAEAPDGSTSSGFEVHPARDSRRKFFCYSERSGDGPRAGASDAFSLGKQYALAGWARVKVHYLTNSGRAPPAPSIFLNAPSILCRVTGGRRRTPTPPTRTNPQGSRRFEDSHPTLRGPDLRRFRAAL